MSDAGIGIPNHGPSRQLTVEEILQPFGDDCLEAARTAEQIAHIRGEDETVTMELLAERQRGEQIGRVTIIGSGIEERYYLRDTG